LSRSSSSSRRSSSSRSRPSSTSGRRRASIRHPGRRSSAAGPRFGFPARRSRGPSRRRNSPVAQQQQRRLRPAVRPADPPPWRPSSAAVRPPARRSSSSPRPAAVVGGGAAARRSSSPRLLPVAAPRGAVHPLPPSRLPSSVPSSRSSVCRPLRRSVRRPSARPLRAAASSCACCPARREGAAAFPGRPSIHHWWDSICRCCSFSPAISSASHSTTSHRQRFVLCTCGPSSLYGWPHLQFIAHTVPWMCLFAALHHFYHCLASCWPSFVIAAHILLLLVSIYCNSYFACACCCHLLLP